MEENGGNPVFNFEEPIQETVVEPTFDLAEESLEESGKFPKWRPGMPALGPSPLFHNFFL